MSHRFKSSNQVSQRKKARKDNISANNSCMFMGEADSFISNPLGTYSMYDESSGMELFSSFSVDDPVIQPSCSSCCISAGQQQWDDVLSHCQEMDTETVSFTEDMFTPPNTVPEPNNALNPEEKSETAIQPSNTVDMNSSFRSAPLFVWASKIKSLISMEELIIKEQREMIHQSKTQRKSERFEEKRSQLSSFIDKIESLQKEVENVRDCLFVMFQRHLLAPEEIGSLTELMGLVCKMATELNVYFSEASSLLKGTLLKSERVKSKLVVMPPMIKRSVMKGNTMSFDVHVIHPLSEFKSDKHETVLRADAVIEDQAKKDMPEVVFNGSRPVVSRGKSSVHMSVRCPTGSSKRPVRLLFSEDSNQSMMPVLSDPVIVVTNSAQWHDAEGILLCNDLFGDYSVIPWERFCNTLQWWVIDATKQKLDSAHRALTVTELAYLGVKACATIDSRNGRIHISAVHWHSFWSFFGSCMEKLRHQRNLIPMWQRGLILGFGTKEESHRLLSGRPDGSFVIRFSDTFPGVFAADFMFGGTEHHVLIKDHDASGSKRSVMEFLHAASYLTHVVSIQPSSQLLDQSIPGPLVDKDSILREYFLTRPLKGQTQQEKHTLRAATLATMYEDWDMR